MVIDNLRTDCKRLVGEILRSGKLSPVAQHLALVVTLTADPLTRSARFSGRDLERLTGWGKSTIAEHVGELDGLFTVVGNEGSGKMEIYLPNATPRLRPPHPAYNAAIPAGMFAEPGKPEMRDTAIKAFGRVCSHCERRSTDRNGPDGFPWSLDRLVPGIEGGQYEAANVTLACLTCNIARGPRPLSKRVYSLAEVLASHREWRNAYVAAGYPTYEGVCE